MRLTLLFASALSLLSAQSFLAPSDYAAGAKPVGLASADFNGDGFPDVAVANAGSETVTVLLGSSQGFQPGVAYPSGSGQAVALVSADFNNDGKPDLAIANGTS